MSEPLKYLSHYPQHVQAQVRTLIERGGLKTYLLDKYPTPHSIGNDKALREHVMQFKNRYLKKSAPLSKVIFDNRIHVVNHALGLHSYVSRVQGNRLKSKHEIRISSVFKATPQAFLDMISVHELAHLKEKEHNKAFYQLCQYMLPSYHQLEFDLRLFLLQTELEGALYEPTGETAGDGCVV
ncbi:YgjP-like metallopeptidase domain-containing protein [Ferrimonas pelagia]|uniref:M48 family metallopeptidase n=1 Tax=Ferrimonas pelagia TaxID=1177826 RepID=A0ABP9FJA7_9GAMM